MARIKKGLWYLCKESFGQFVKGYYYYCDEDNTLMVKAHKPTYVWPEDRKHFNKGKVIRIADVARKNAEFDILEHIRKKFQQAVKKANQSRKSSHCLTM